MSQLAIDAPVRFSDTDLEPIIVNASFLWERLNPERFLVSPEHIDQSEIERRCDRWRQTVSHEDNPAVLQKRLQWEEQDLAAIRPRLGTVQLAVGQPCPTWVETLRQIMQAATEFTPAAEGLQLTDPTDPIPFEDVLLPAVKVARHHLQTCLGYSHFTLDQDALSILSAGAYCALERSLLQRLSQLCSKTLEFEFSKLRSFGQNLISLLGVADNNRQSDLQYRQFVEQLLQDGLFNFFQSYPVLGRLVATSVEFWVTATAEFIQRLYQDQDAIWRTFDPKAFSQSQDSELEPVLMQGPQGNVAGNPPAAQGAAFRQKGQQESQVVDIKTSLSDPHNQGRTVFLLIFESGLKLIYKPKNLGLEIAWNQVLDWCNQQSKLLDFKVISILNRENYGWVEYVEQQPCLNAPAAERFYQRAGMLLCLIYTLRGTDCHQENLIASGEHLVLIDMETLLHHDASLIENSPAFQEMETRAGQQFWDSVLRTGLLPRWDFSADKQVAQDVSGLGSADSQQGTYKVPCWHAINTDNMRQRYETVTIPVEKNVPFLGHMPLSPNDYQTQIVDGFEQMYRFLVEHRETLLSQESPLVALQQQQVRFVFRATRIYFMILERAWAPKYLKHGVDYSIELDHLSRAFLVAQDKPAAWSILKAELQALEQLDIPHFTASTSSDALRLKHLSTIPHYFTQPSYSQMLSQLTNLSEDDLNRQRSLIQNSFYARVAESSSVSSDIGHFNGWETQPPPLLTSEALIAEAKTIADELAARAIQNPSGSLDWVGLSYAPEAERFQLQILGDSLYDGRSGMGVFLAALYHVTGDLTYRDLTWGSLQSLRQRLQTLDIESQQRFARLTGLGGALGLGSLIYALVTVSYFLDDETVLSDAQKLACLITPELIGVDHQLDLLGGSAGAILGLLSLHQATGERTVLETALACGQHLVAHQSSFAEMSNSWSGSQERPLTGFSHGAAGIAYALLRLYAATQKQEFSEAALIAMEYERHVFSETEANWPDFRGLKPDDPLAFLVQWCHGAPGIGLGRLGCLDMLDDSAIRDEIEIALQTTYHYGLQAVDHLCCGNLGRVEVLLVAAQRLTQPRWYQAALQNATHVVARARQTGGYQLFPNLPNSVFNPTFFQGTAGIGYELLRLARPELPSILLWH